ncbi:39S ribosomal protein L15, mitochondrial [Armadillidium vulgare]|nr:39S ribosomal protein L15, mitochondrial [Armadillidium vulgare]
MGNFPFHLRFRSQNWNEDVRIKLSYCPLPLNMLQQIIDLGRVRTDIPIDACQLSQSGMLAELCPMEKEGGYLLQDEGLDVFQAQVNLEVQWATEPIIAAIERTGSVITTAYYDPFSLEALKDPIAFFEKGKPIRKRMLPPQNLIEYYSDPKNREIWLRAARYKEESKL